MTNFNPLKTYTVYELAELMQCHPARVRDWVQVGLIKGIKTGKSLVFSFEEIKTFQNEMKGRDISSLPKIIKGETV